MKEEPSKLNIILKEYETARHEWEYYTNLFNKQDNLFSVYFAIFIAVMGVIYYIAKESNAQMFSLGFVLTNSQKILIATLVIFLAIVYTYVFITMMGTSYYLIIYSSKLIVLEKKINELLGEDILFWESKFMSQIQSTNNTITKGFLNVNLLKAFYAALIYLVVEGLLIYLWFMVFGIGIIFFIYCTMVLATFLFHISNWIRMWCVLPNHYKEVLMHIYFKKEQ